MLRCITPDMPYGSKISEDRRNATIILESDAGTPTNFTAAIDELQSREAKNYALSCAGHYGLASPSLNGFVSAPFAVNAEGIPLMDIELKPNEQRKPDDPRFQPHRFRAEFPLGAAH